MLKDKFKFKYREDSGDNTIYTATKKGDDYVLSYQNQRLGKESVIATYSQLLTEEHVRHGYWVVQEEEDYGVGTVLTLQWYNTCEYVQFKLTKRKENMWAYEGQVHTTYLNSTVLNAIKHGVWKVVKVELDGAYISSCGITANRIQAGTIKTSLSDSEWAEKYKCSVIYRPDGTVLLDAGWLRREAQNGDDVEAAKKQLENVLSSRR
jgi:hypothetical protein